MMSELNEHLQEAGRLDRFVTFGAGLLDPATHAIDFANAGHCAPLIYRKATDTFEEGISSDQTGLPLGILEGIRYDSNTVALGSGDCVVLMTDGVTECKNKDEKDLKPEEILAALRAGPMIPRAMGERLVAAVHQHALGRKPHDDLTVVVFGRTTS
jgi:phosphoserine phosphatase RsbU/P